MAHSHPLVADICDRLSCRSLDEALDRLAERTLASASQDRLPVSLESVAAQFGIRDIRYERIPVDACLIPTSATEYKVVVSSEASQSRQRFSLAHEIAHAAIHALIPETRRFATRTIFTQPQSRVEERLCDAIAARLLMPGGLIRLAWSQREISIPLIQAVARDARVSLAAAARRLNEVSSSTFGVLHVHGAIGQPVRITRVINLDGSWRRLYPGYQLPVDSPVGRAIESRGEVADWAWVPLLNVRYRWFLKAWARGFCRDGDAAFATISADPECRVAMAEWKK